MAYKDLREFIAACRADGDCLEIDRPVKADCEIGWALKKSYSNGGPLMMFNHVVDNEGKEKKYPAVGGVYGCREKAVKAFQTDAAHIFEKFNYGLNHPIAPVMYKGAAPCQEVVLTGDEINLDDLPIPKFSCLDGGYYITAGITVSKDPETGISDIGHYRYMVHDKKTLGVMAQPFHRFGKNTWKAVRMGKDVIQAAIILGVDPIIAYSCPLTGIPDSVDDWTLAGGLRQEPVELVKCKTVDLEVPAYAEMIIEIEVDLKQTKSEGPLGEFTGYFTPASDKFVAHVKCITHRKDPLFQVVMTGKPTPVTENHVLKQLGNEASIFHYLKSQFPGVTDVSLPCSGGCQERLVVSMKQRFAGEARQVALYAMGSDLRPKTVIIVDTDINVHDSSEVEWALAYRMQPAKDIFIIPSVPGGPCDPSNRTEGKLISFNDTMGIDATCPYGSDYAVVADAPGWQDYDFPELMKR